MPKAHSNEERDLLVSLANKISNSTSPDEDSRIEIAYAIARYLNLPWPCAYEVDEVSDESLDAAVDVFDGVYEAEYFHNGATDNKRAALKAVIEAERRAAKPTPPEREEVP